MAEKTEKPKTLFDCAKSDYQNLEQIESGLNRLIGHEMFGITITGFWYRGHIFDITLMEKR